MLIAGGEPSKVCQVLASGTALHFKAVSTAYVSYDVASGSEITPCNTIDKPLVVYRFSGNFMTSITTLLT